MNEVDIARVCHEVNRAYCEALNDFSQSPWEDTSEEIRDSAISGVHFHLSAVHPPSASHQAWYEWKLARGWTYGPNKDEALKQHPCMVPFEQLPVEQAAKDYIFRAVILALKPFLTRSEG